MYQLSISGRCAAPAETRTTQGGKSVTTFRVATDVWGGKEKRTMWTTVVIWGERGEKLAPHIAKGTVVSAWGQLDVREHDGKHYVEIKNADVTLLGGGQKAEPTDREHKRGGGPTGGKHPADDLDDAIPFHMDR